MKRFTLCETIFPSKFQSSCFCPLTQTMILIVSEFRLALIDICAARNNNAQLTTEAKANQRGFYEEIRKLMPKDLADRVEWKTNEWGSDASCPIKVRDIVALAWIPLALLHEAGMLPTQTESGSPLNFAVLPQNIYRNKGELSMLFDKLMVHPDVSKQRNGPQYEMHNSAIGSAFEVLAALPSRMTRSSSRWAIFTTRRPAANSARSVQSRCLSADQHILHSPSRPQSSASRTVLFFRAATA